MNAYEKALFLLVVLLIPVQLGKHFWPYFAFVQGIRVDYLSPTLYISDIAILLLFLVSVKSLRKKLKEVLFSFPVLVFIFILFVSSIFAKSPPASFYAILKFFELFYLSVFVASKVNKLFIGKTLYCLIFGSLIECIILFLQLISKHSLGGVFYFLGERSFSISTIGIAKFSFGGNWILRPYGTFPHPNVLAFYLFITFVLLLFYSIKAKLLNILKLLILSILFLGIIFTFSRIIILFTIIVCLYYLFINFRKSFSIFAILFFVLFLVLLPRFLGDFRKDVFLRLDLLRIAFIEFTRHSILGVGLNNFYYYEINYQKNVTPVLLQPVHNIYLLWLSETGIVSFFFSIFFVIKTLKRQLLKIRNVKNNNAFDLSVLILLVSSLIFGLFDHYLITLQQGQIILALLLGFSYGRVKA